MDWQNATIESTFLGFSEGILTWDLHLVGDHWAQTFGGYRLISEHLRDILNTVGVEAWEALPGKIVRIVQSDERIQQIGHPILERWFKP